MSFNELAFKTVTELAKMLRTKKISSVELTQYFLNRLEQYGPNYNALAQLARNNALKQAYSADRAIHKGELTSPLQGIPYGAKDLLATKNIPTRWGAPPYRNQVFDFDATAVERLRENGAVLVGKLAMVELAGGGGYAYAKASLHGPGLNPWNIKHWSGGSSSGSGSAVAAGLVPYALGSETWGSIVTPSTYCGITGLRPTWGLVSRYGAMELGWTMDKVGPMARTAEDCGWILQAIAGEDVRDNTTWDHPPFLFKPRIKRAGFRIGVLPADFTGVPDIEKAYKHALRVLKKAGMTLVNVEIDDSQHAAVARTLLNGESAAAHAELIKSKRLNELVDANQKRGLKRNLQQSSAEFVRALQHRRQMAYEFFNLMNDFDALVSPSLVAEAPTLETNLQKMTRRRGGYAVLGALFGIPQISLPMGFGAQGLPLGISFHGDLFFENTLLQIGMIFQRETDWHLKTPNLSEK